MKKYFFTLLTIIITCIPVSAAFGESDVQEAMLIKSYQADLTGDGLLETIELRGNPFSNDSAYFHDIWAEIKSPENDQTWNIHFGGGYEPKIEFVDLNHDTINDLLYQSPTGGSGGLYHYDLYTLAKNQLLEIPLPEQRYVTGQFLENFTVQIRISPNDEPLLMDVRDRSKDYIRLGIYDKKGQLKQPTELMIDPIAFFEPVKISDSKGYGLRSYKQISGAYHADQLGTVETLWYYTDGEWIILQTDWHESS